LRSVVHRAPVDAVAVPVGSGFRGKVPPRRIRVPIGGGPAMVLIRSHDALFRFVFGEPEQMAELLRIQLPAAVTAAIDWPSLCRIEGTFGDKALQARHSDLLFTASVAGGEVLLDVLCEHKSAPEPLVPLQLARYVVRIHDRWVADHPGTCRLPVVLPFLLPSRGTAMDRRRQRARPGRAAAWARRCEHLPRAAARPTVRAAGPRDDGRGGDCALRSVGGHGLDAPLPAVAALARPRGSTARTAALARPDHQPAATPARTRRDDGAILVVPGRYPARPRTPARRD
jgi:hypothetical protein